MSPQFSLRSENTSFPLFALKRFEPLAAAFLEHRVMSFVKKQSLLAN